LIEWSAEQDMIRTAVAGWVDAEVRPHLDALESGEVGPYDIIRKFMSTFGLDAMARAEFKKRIERESDDRAGDDRAGDGRAQSEAADLTDPVNMAAFSIIPIIELSRVCPGLVTAMGVSLGLAGGTIMRRGNAEQKERWGLDLLTLDKVGAWAITEPDSGSDAFGGMRSTARRDGDEYILNGSKTFITNGPYADTIVIYVKLDDGRDDVRDPRQRDILTFVLDSGMPGLEQSPPLRKMGLHASPTGQLFLIDVRVGPDRLLKGSTTADAEEVVGGRESARENFVTERAGIAAMALGVIDECLRLSVDYAKTRQLWGQRIGDFQLIQLKLARMEVARLNVQNLVFRHIEMSDKGRPMSLAEASAMKLYAAQAAHDVAQDALQLFGGNGYMSEYRVEQLARDARSFQIYAGTDEIQVTHIARDLLSR
jgi:alkylation response protein AidB-like acyl-CoA dehydrogenase